MSEHTPGPWEATPNDSVVMWHQSAEDPEPIRITIGTLCEADAHLIAAAPDLLEAAKEMVLQWREAYDRGLIDAMPMVVKNLETAIEKASRE